MSAWWFGLSCFARVYVDEECVYVRVGNISLSFPRNGPKCGVRNKKTNKQTNCAPQGETWKPLKFLFPTFKADFAPKRSVLLKGQAPWRPLRSTRDSQCTDIHSSACGRTHILCACVLAMGDLQQPSIRISQLVGTHSLNSTHVTRVVPPPAPLPLFLTRARTAGGLLNHRAGSTPSPSQCRIHCPRGRKRFGMCETTMVFATPCSLPA